jgi:hypothetical protein
LLTVLRCNLSSRVLQDRGPPHSAPHRSGIHHLSYSLLPQPHSQAVQLARHRGESPPHWFLFRCTRIHDNGHQNFLVHVNPRDLHRFLLAWKRQNAREKGYTRHVLPPFLTPIDGATQIGSKRGFPIKLKNGLTSSRVLTTFAVHATWIVHAPTQPNFHVNWWAAGPWELKTPVAGVNKCNRDYRQLIRLLAAWITSG